MPETPQNNTQSNQQPITPKNPLFNTNTSHLYHFVILLSKKNLLAFKDYYETQDIETILEGSSRLLKCRGRLVAEGQATLWHPGCGFQPLTAQNAQNCHHTRL